MATTDWNMTAYERDLHADDSLTRDFWMALMSTATSETEAGVEFTAADYGRIQVTMTKDGAVAGKLYNHGGTVGPWLPETHWGLAVGGTVYDAETDGNARYFFDLDEPGIDFVAGVPRQIAVDALVQRHK